MKKIALLLTMLALPLPLTAAPNQSVTTMPPAQKEIIKLTEQGIKPQSFALSKKDSSIFFLNTTESSLATIAVDFGKHRAHCASPNLALGEDGVLRSSKPIGPKDFAIACFPDTGVYQVVVKGIGSKDLTGQIIVE
jgi:hypothetical protein